MGPLPLALLALAAHAKKPKGDATPPPRSAPPAAFPAGEIAATVAPQVTGLDSVLALEGLTRDSYTFTFAADTAPLTGLDPDAIDAVFALLAADPNWRVTRDAGGRVAWLRDERAGFVVGVDGWHVAGGSCWRVGLREGQVIEADWGASPKVARVPAATPKIVIPGFRPDGAVCNTLATALRIEGTLTLEVFEAAPNDKRPVTIDALEELPYKVANAAFAAATIRSDGFDPLGLPDAEPLKITEPTVTVGPAGAGALLVRGRVNPGEPGWSWVRILGSDGAPWEEDRIGPATLEMPGWSRDPTHGFYLQSTVPVPPGPAFEGTAELWFQGADGKPRRLATSAVSVPAR